MAKKKAERRPRLRRVQRSPRKRHHRKANAAFMKPVTPSASLAEMVQFDPNPPHRSHQASLGVHQEEQSAGPEEQAHDQGRRQAEGRIRRQGAGQHVRDDEAGRQTSEVAESVPGCVLHPAPPFVSAACLSPVSWLSSLVIALLTGIISLFASGVVAALAVEWYRISSFEGGSGFFVIGMALLGGMAGTVIGLIAARLSAARAATVVRQGVGHQCRRRAGLAAGDWRRGARAGRRSSGDRRRDLAPARRAQIARGRCDRSRRVERTALRTGWPRPRRSARPNACTAKGRSGSRTCGVRTGAGIRSRRRRDFHRARQESDRRRRRRQDAARLVDAAAGLAVNARHGMEPVVSTGAGGPAASAGSVQACGIAWCAPAIRCARCKPARWGSITKSPSSTM